MLSLPTNGYHAMPNPTNELSCTCSQGTKNTELISIQNITNLTMWLCKSIISSQTLINAWDLRSSLPEDRHELNYNQFALDG